ncbi:hypothetical protein J3R30DRAFT_3696542 [Lentinula aciculospora]|uniref:Uncharacterized protein n=1 Tax=Lentinula aciculospora TaxID=153920 RepID=A0A9W9AKZ8_9AGAR|nr:hypothetical protein J3R30DRAFT_3696542 [Lentinula aciculospora]
MFCSSKSSSTLLLFAYFFALGLSTQSMRAFAAPIRGRSGPQLGTRDTPLASREFVSILQDRDGTIRISHPTPRDGLYTTYNETHAQYHGDGDSGDSMQRRSTEPFSSFRRNSARQFQESCEVQCGSQSANINDITAAEAALHAQFSSSQTGLSWGMGTSIGTNGSVFQVVNSVYAYGCDLGGGGQTTTSEEYTFQVECLSESCGSYVGMNRDKNSKRVFGRDVGGFKCN